MTMLGMPGMPATVPPPRTSGPVSFTAGHHFAVTSEASVDELAEAAAVPLSVILQVTKRCNFDCTFCSALVAIICSSRSRHRSSKPTQAPGFQQ